MTKIIYILLFILCFSFVSATDYSIDTFEDNDYTSDPVWDYYGGSGSYAVQSGVAKNGTYALKFSSTVTSEWDKLRNTTNGINYTTNDDLTGWFQKESGAADHALWLYGSGGAEVHLLYTGTTDIKLYCNAADQGTVISSPTSAVWYKYHFLYEGGNVWNLSIHDASDNYLNSLSTSCDLGGTIDRIEIWNFDHSDSGVFYWDDVSYIENATVPPSSSSSVSSVAITSPVYLNNNSTATWTFTNSTGGNSSEQSNITWYVNGVSTYSETGVAGTHTLLEGNFTNTDSLIIQVTPYDGVASGTAVNSSAVTVGLLTSNNSIHDTNILHGSQVNFNLTLNTNVANDITSFNSIIFEFNNTNTTATYGGVYTGTEYKINVSNIQMPNITGLTEQFNYTWYVNLTAEGQTYAYEFTNTSTLSLFGIDDCSTYSIIWANFSIRDEADDSVLTGDLSAFFEYTADDYTDIYNISETNTTSWDFCLHPDWANETVDILAQYSSTGYESRDYIAEGYTLDNVTDQILLYTILTSLTTDITVGVTDGADNELQGILIYAEKYDIGTNTYTLVESEYTDTNGEGIFQLTFNQDYYRFKLYDNGVLSLTTDRFKIFTTTYDYILSTSGTSILEEYLSTKSAITQTLAFDSVTNNVTLTYSESNAIINSVCLEVANINQSYYDSCDTSGSATLNYVLDNRNTSYTGRVYYTTTTGNEYTLQTISIPELTKSDTWGQNLGLAVSIIIFLCLTLLGLGMGIQNKTSINAVMILSIFALILLKVFGFLPLGTATTVGTVCLAIIIIFVLNKR